MGIKNLHKFLQKHVPNYSDEIHLSDFKGYKFAVDINIYLYEYKRIYRDNWPRHFLDLIISLLKYEIRCIFIYDSNSPIEKKDTKDERRQKKQNARKRLIEIQDAEEEYNSTKQLPLILKEIIERRSIRIKQLLPGHASSFVYDQEAVDKEKGILLRENVNITKNDYQLSRTLLDLFRITYCNADMEAETLCAYLCVHGIVDAVLTDDTDVLGYGTPVFLTKLCISSKKKQVRCPDTVMRIRYSHILESLDMSAEQFRDLCIMCGTDYNKNIFRIGHEKAFKLLKKHGDIDGIAEHTSHDVTVLNHNRVRELFSVPDELDNIPTITPGTFPSPEDMDVFATRYNFKCSRSAIEFLSTL